MNINDMCYERPFSPLLPCESEDFARLISQREAEFTETTEHDKIHKELEDAIQAVKNGNKNGDMLIEESVNALWIAAFKAGYKAGMVDIMAGITLKESGVISPKYYKGA